MKFCIPLGEWETAPWRGERAEEMLEFDLGGEFQIEDVEFCRESGGEAESTFDDLGWEPNRADLDFTERRLIGADRLLSVGEELQRRLDESLRGRRGSSRSLRVRM